MTIEETKQTMVDVFRAMYHQNMLTLFEGNVSMRWGDHLLISPSQKNKETMTKEMIIETDFDGNVISAMDGCRPSSEFKMHREVYRLRPDIQAAVHCHSPFATAFAVAGKELAPEGVAEINLLFGKVPLARYGRTGSEDIYKDFAELFEEYDSVLLENHGILCTGKTIEMALARAETIEKTAKIMFISHILGGEKPLPPEEVNFLREVGGKMRKKARGIENK